MMIPDVLIFSAGWCFDIPGKSIIFVENEAIIALWQVVLLTKENSRKNRDDSLLRPGGQG